MKKAIFGISILLLGSILYSLPAHAELLAVDQYLSVKLGYSGIIADPIRIKGSLVQPNNGYTKKSYISTPNVSFSIGTYYATQYVAIRGETEYTARFNAGKNVASIPTQNGSQTLSLSNTVQTVLLNLFLDFNTHTLFVPYIGAGLGMSIIDSKYTLQESARKKLYLDFSWQVSLGAAFYIVPALAIDIQTRYSAFGEPRYGAGDRSRLIYTASGVDVFIGIRYTL